MDSSLPTTSPTAAPPAMRDRRRAVVRLPDLVPAIIATAAGTALAAMGAHGGAAEPAPGAAAIALALMLLVTGGTRGLVRARVRTCRQAIAAVPRAATAWRQAPDGRREQVDVAALAVGDLVWVADGQIVPADGVVVAGRALVDESALAPGAPVGLREPDTCTMSGVLAGARVEGEGLLIRIATPPPDALLERLAGQVAGPAPAGTRADAVLAAALAAWALVPTGLAAWAAWHGVAARDLWTGLALVVGLQPVPLALLPRTGVLAAWERLTRLGVVARDPEALEAAGGCEAWVFDRTGTLTFGVNLADDFIPVGGHPREALTVAAMAASWMDETAEGRSVVALALREGVRPRATWRGGTAIATDGLVGMAAPEEPTYLKGRPDVVERFVRARDGRVPPDLEVVARQVLETGGEAMAVLHGREVIGVIRLRDPLKPALRTRLARARRPGIRAVLCTGEAPGPARVTAQAVGLDDFVARAGVIEKLALVRAERGRARRVAMVGDGADDAPALAAADVGLAMASGAPLAREAARLIDLGSDPARLFDVVALGRRLHATRTALGAFSIAGVVAKGLVLGPALGLPVVPAIVHVYGPHAALVAVLGFDAIATAVLVPVTLAGVEPPPGPLRAALRHVGLVFALAGLVLTLGGVLALEHLIGPVLAP